MISGAVLGSCFPPLFGGECSGIPKDCKPCIDVCTGYSDQELVIHLDEDGNILHSGPENLKKSRPKKLVESNKSISRKKFFDQNPFFAISKMAKNQFLN